MSEINNFKVNILNPKPQRSKPYSLLRGFIDEGLLFDEMQCL